MGTIGTRRRFIDLRLAPAQHEWARLKATDSLECRNRRSCVAMDLSRQPPRGSVAAFASARRDGRLLQTGE